MKIFYIARHLGTEVNGIIQVMNRNLNSLEEIFGAKNIQSYYFDKPSIKKVATSILKNTSYGVLPEEEDEAINKIINFNPDLIFIETTLLGNLVKKLNLLNKKIICMAHNQELSLTKQELLSRSPLISIPKYFGVKYNEKLSVKYSDFLVTLNKRDSNNFFHTYSRSADIILPITFPKNIQIKEKNDLINQKGNYFLFVGSDFFPNIEGIKWFIKNVAPFVNKNFHIVGSCCNNHELRNLNLPSNVILKGYVENLSDEYKNSSGIISPIFKGSGMKTKTIEALSYNKSIYGTSEAFVGIEADYNKIGALCNTAEEFIIALKNSNEKKINLYTEEIHIKHFSNESFNNQFKKFIEKIINIQNEAN